MKKPPNRVAAGGLCLEGADAIRLEANVHDPIAKTVRRLDQALHVAAAVTRAITADVEAIAAAPVAVMMMMPAAFPALG